MAGMEKFHTRSKANEGRKLFLATPDGERTEHWLLILSQHSDKFRRARDTALQLRAKEIALIKDLEERRERAQDELGVVQAALVAGWSFEEPCTAENVQTFLREAPQIGDAISRFAEDDAAFFAASPSSTTGQETKAGSAGETSQTAQPSESS